MGLYVFPIGLNSIYHPDIGRRWCTVKINGLINGLMLARRLRRRANIKTTLGQSLVFAYDGH